MTTCQSLQDLCASKVAAAYPFALVETRCGGVVPEPVQRKIILYSFPQSEEYVLLYAENDDFRSSNYAVSSVVQIGFYLSGHVEAFDKSSAGADAAVLFDRRRITATKCSCNMGAECLSAVSSSSNASASIFFCDHVVSLCIYRIRRASEIKISLPISDTLSSLSRLQLQTLVQYLLHSHTETLPTAQLLADQLLSKKLEHITGAPDPTAGGAVEDDLLTSIQVDNLDEVARRLVGAAEGGFTERLERFWKKITKKISMMLYCGDGNAERLLLKLTTSLKSSYISHSTNGVNHHVTVNPSVKLRDKLRSLWTKVALNPRLKPRERHGRYETQLKTLGYEDLVPLLDVDYSKIHDDLRSTALKIHALRAYGQEDQAMEYSLALIKRFQREEEEDCHSHHSLRSRTQGASVTQYFTCCVPPRESSLRRASDQPQPCSSIPIDLKLVSIVYNMMGKSDESAAVRFALRQLICGREVFSNSYEQEKHFRQEEMLVKSLRFDYQVYSKVLGGFLGRSSSSPAAVAQIGVLGESEPCKTGGLGGIQHPFVPSVPTYPCYALAEHVFRKMRVVGVDESKNKIGFRFLLKVLGQSSHTPNGTPATVCDERQVALATTTLQLCKEEQDNLELLTRVVKTLRTPVVFRIVQDLYKASQPVESNTSSSAAAAVGGTTGGTATSSSLLQVCFQLLLHLLRTVKSSTSSTRRRWEIVRFTINIQLNFCDVCFLLDNWSEFFTPSEAVGSVVNHFLSRGAALRLNFTYVQQQRVNEKGQRVALEALRVDPVSCSLNALTICETDLFEQCFDVVMNSANGMQTNQIFTIARYIEHRGFPLKAYQLAVLGVGMLSVPFNQETHPQITDIHWTCNLATQLGDEHLSNLLPLIISNIKCASVLSEILKRFAMETPRKLSRTTSDNFKMYTRLKLLVEATINSYVQTVHNRLSHISPRHYADFVEYLAKAKESFLFDPDGVAKFFKLIESIKLGYKGKKKLVMLLTNRFG